MGVGKKTSGKVEPGDRVVGRRSRPSLRDEPSSRRRCNGPAAGARSLRPYNIFDFPVGDERKPKR
jgi:hypothetical protein